MSEPRVQRVLSSDDQIAPKKYDFRIDSRRLIVQVEPDLIVGRRKPDDQSDDVDIDLARFGAGDLGVSRRHVQLLVEAGDVFVIDLKTTNGTRLNGKSLRPGQPYRVRDSDELELGRLRVTVRFQWA